MRLMRVSLAVLGVLGLIGFVLTFAFEAVYKSRARLIQIVELDPQALKNGGQGYLVEGAPELMVLDNDRAILPGFGDKGERLVNAAYLIKNKSPAIPLSRIELIAWMARAGCAADCLVCLIGFLMIPGICSRTEH